MQKIGAHVSAAKGVSNAPLNAVAEGCEVFQFFISPPQTYKFNSPTDEQIALFKEYCQKHAFDQTYVHAPYLVNLCSPKPNIKHASISMLRKTLDAADALGVTGMMFHTGSAAGYENKQEALDIAVQSMDKILDGYKGKTKLLIENAAGANAAGNSFAEVGYMLKNVKNKKSMGVCLDTQHSFGSGYDWRTKEGTAKALKEFDKEIGINNLIVIQANDSKVECGSNKDRHEHIGEGLMGKISFENLLRHPKLKNMAWILETEFEGRDKDLNILKKIRG